MPGLVDVLYGVHLRSDPEAMFPSRIAASKEFGMVACTLASSNGSRRRWWYFGVVGDLAGTGAGLLGLRDGLSKRTVLPLVATALTAAGLGCRAIAEEA